MTAEDSYYICEIQVHPTNNGNNVMMPHVMDNAEYYNAGPIETRYIIRNPLGMVTEYIYKNQSNDSCVRFQEHMIVTRKYIRPIDGKYFKYYDDAEEVLENIKRFIQWIKKKATIRFPGKKTLAILEENRFLIRNTSYSAEQQAMRDSQIGLKVKRRSELVGEKQNILDIKGYLKLVQDRERKMLNTLRPKKNSCPKKPTSNAQSADAGQGCLFTM
jgi:hypothetical protein